MAHHQSHVAWIGCSLHDLIQPSFSFLVGVALPFSLASRAARGQSRTRMAAAGVIGLAAGAASGWVGVCPVVKRIWTPSWVLYSGGWCFLLLAAFYLVVDIWGFRRWAFPLVVIGTNSIAAYCIAHLFDGFIGSSLDIHVGASVFRVFGQAYEPLIQGALVLFVMWLLLFWMYRRKIFLRI